MAQRKTGTAERKPKPKPERKEPEKVDEASEESFPASDPPSWSPTEPGAPPRHDSHDEGER